MSLIKKRYDGFEADRRFPMTSWSLVIAAGQKDALHSRDALGELCGLYWYPLYAYIRRQGLEVDQAQDLTQAFFAVMLEKNYIQDARRERGNFRSFLLACLKHFLLNERDRETTLKRGGGTVPISLEMSLNDAESQYALDPGHDLTPERMFEQQWAMTIMKRVQERLAREFARTRKMNQYEKLRGFIAEKTDIPYRKVAVEMGATEGAVKIAVHRLRRRFREVLRDEVAQTVSNAGEVDEEIRFLIASLHS